MTMTPYVIDVQRAIKWLHSNAPHVTKIIQDKAAFYNTNQNIFWENWKISVFDLRTANTFGLMVWCIILGVPSQLFGLYPGNFSWAYGPNRQNFKYSGGAVANPNTVGGNFYGGGDTTLLSIQEVRWALQLRYAMLISNGSVKYVNRMLAYIFNEEKPWDFAAGKYFYCTDSTGITPAGSSSPNIVGAFKVEYRIGRAMNFSGQFLNLLNKPEYGIVPQFGGSKITVIQE